MLVTGHVPFVLDHPRRGKRIDLEPAGQPRKEVSVAPLEFAFTPRTELRAELGALDLGFPD